MWAVFKDRVVSHGGGELLDQGHGRHIRNQRGLGASDVLDVSFIVTNPAEDQNSPTISIAAIIKNDDGTTVASISGAEMVKPGAAVFGVTNGEDPLEVRKATFSLKSVRQSMPVSGKSNSITISLTPNYNLNAGTTVTISGLTGSETATSNASSAA